MAGSAAYARKRRAVVPDWMQSLVITKHGLDSRNYYVIGETEVELTVLNRKTNNKKRLSKEVIRKY